MATEPPPRPPVAPNRPSSAQITPADLERFADEDLIRSAQDEARLRDEAPPHHR